MTTEELKKQTATYLDQLASEADDARKSEAFQAWLGVCARFHKYSWGNQLMIAFHKPDATRVAGFHTWKDLGRLVKKGEKGIPIWVPIKVKRQDAEGNDVEYVPSFKVGYVFDIAQTEGKDIPELPWTQLEGDYTPIYERLATFASGKGIKVSRVDLPADVLGFSSMGLICLSKAMTESESVPTFVHELAHEVMHDLERRMKEPIKNKEAEAEATAYAVCQHLGIPHANSGTYLALYRIDKDDLTKALANVQKAVHEIISALESEAA